MLVPLSVPLPLHVRGACPSGQPASVPGGHVAPAERQAATPPQVSQVRPSAQYPAPQHVAPDGRHPGDPLQLSQVRPSAQYPAPQHVCPPKRHWFVPLQDVQVEPEVQRPSEPPGEAGQQVVSGDSQEVVPLHVNES